MSEKSLGRVICGLILRKNAAAPDSAEYHMAERQLRGLRDAVEGAGAIIEAFDPDWRSYCQPPPSIMAGPPAS